MISSRSSPTQMQVTCGEPSVVERDEVGERAGFDQPRALCGSFMLTGCRSVRAGQAVGRICCDVARVMRPCGAGV